MVPPSQLAALLSVRYMEPLTVVELAQTTENYSQMMLKSRKKFARIEMKEGQIMLNGTEMFRITIGRSPVIATRKINGTYELSLIQTLPFWIIQVENREEVDRTALMILVHLQRIMRGPINVEITPQTLNGFCQLVLHGRIDTCSVLKMTDMEHVGFHEGDYRCLLTNLNFEILVHRPHEMPPFEMVRQVRNLHLPNVNTWFTLEHLFKMQCEFLEIGYITNTRDAFVMEEFGRTWLDSKELKPWKFFRFFDGGMYRSAGVPGTQWDDSRRPRYFKYNDQTTERHFWDAKTGLDVTRSDGTIATFLQLGRHDWEGYGFRNVLFLVWSPLDIAKYRSLPKKDRMYQNSDQYRSVLLDNKTA